MRVTREQVAAIGGARSNIKIAAMVAGGIVTYGARFRVSTALECAHFLGQSAHESGGFSRLVENLNYRAERIRQVWPSRFKSVAAARPYAHNPEALANKVYSRAELGNIQAGDGWRFRGRGIKQITGRYNYRAFTAWCREVLGRDSPDFEAQPDLLTEAPWAFLSAVWFWHANKVYALAARDDVRAVTKAINGGYNGLTDRGVLTAKAKRVLSIEGTAEATAQPPRHPDPLLMEYQVKLNQISELGNRPEVHVGDADGWMGPKTEAAVTAFQKSVESLPVTGTLGPKTRASIDRVLAGLERRQTAPVEVPKPEPAATGGPVEAPLPTAKKKPWWKFW